MKNNFEPHLVVRMMPAAYLREKLPPEALFDEASAVAYAGRRAKHHNRKVCLAFDESGTFLSLIHI